MATTATATAAPTQITIGSKKYRCSPLTIADFGELERWMRDVALEQLADPAVQALPPDQRAGLQAHISDRAAQLQYSVLPFDTSPSAQLSRAIATSTRGLAMQLWLGIRKHDEDVSVDTIEAGLVDEATIDSLMKEFDRLNALEDDLKKKTGRKKATRKKRNKRSR